MAAIFSQLIEQLNSSVFVLLGILAGFGYCLFFFAKWLGKQEEKESSSSKRLDNLETKLDTVKDVVMELKGKVELIYNNTLAPNYRMTSSSSPIAITEKGQEVAKKLGIEAIVNVNYSGIKNALIENNADIFSKNEYDIQESVFIYTSKSIEHHLSASEINNFKSEAYKRGILVEDLYRILAVIIRDKLFNDIGKNVSDIDKHDPNG